jgi:hypothetical protein
MCGAAGLSICCWAHLAAVVTMRDWTGNVAYKVYWLDQKTGQFQVEIEP